MAKLYDLKSLWLCVGVSTIFAGWGIIRITAQRPGGLIIGVNVAVPRFLPVPVDGRALTGLDEAVLTVPSSGKDCELLVMMK